MSLGLGSKLTKGGVDPYSMYRSRHCVRFDGTDDFLEIADSTTFDHVFGGDSQFTIGCWFKLDALPSIIGDNMTLMSKWVGSTDKREWLLYVTTGNKISFVMSSDGTNDSSGDSNDTMVHNNMGNPSGEGGQYSLSDTKWHHVMLSYNGAPSQTLNWYFDGQLMGSVNDGQLDSDFEAINQDDAPVRIGGFNDGTAYSMLGYIADPIYVNRLVAGGMAAKYMYNKGKPRNLSRFVGYTDDMSDGSSSFLKAYWQMGDNKLDAFNKHTSGITYSANDETGFIVDASESVLNSTDTLNGAGDFSSASGWDLMVTDSNNQATIDTSAGTCRIQQTTGTEYIQAEYDGAMVVGKYYEVEFTVSADNGGSIRILPRDSGQNQSDYPTIDSVGTYKVYFKAERTDLAIARNTAGSTDMTISNITCKEITSGDVAHFRNMTKGIVAESPGIGRDSYSFAFDGTNDYVDCGSASAIDDIFDGGGTIMGWIKAESDGGGNFGRIISKESGANGTDGWSLTVEDEGSGAVDINFMVGHATTYGRWTSASREITLNTWTHFAVVYDDDSTSNNPVIYINGVSVTLTEVSTPAGAKSTDASQNLLIGASALASRYFDGNISDIAIFNKELSAAEVRENMGPGLDLNSLSTTANIVAWWRFGDGQFDYQRVSYHTVGCLGDENNATLGSDVLGGNGDFSDPSYWTVSSGHSVVEDGKGKFLGTGTYGPITKSGILTANQMYEITLDVESNDGGEDGTGRVTLNYGDDWYPKLCDNGGTGIGIKTYFMPNDTDLILYAPNTGGTDYSSKITIDNVVVRPVNGIPGIMKNMTPEDIEKDAP